MKKILVIALLVMTFVTSKAQLQSGTEVENNSADLAETYKAGKAAFEQKNYKQAVVYLEKAAKGGNADAQV